MQIATAFNHIGASSFLIINFHRLIVTRVMEVRRGRGGHGTYNFALVYLQRTFRPLRRTLFYNVNQK